MPSRDYLRYFDVHGAGAPNSANTPYYLEIAPHLAMRFRQIKTILDSTKQGQEGRRPHLNAYQYYALVHLLLQRSLLFLDAVAISKVIETNRHLLTKPINDKWVNDLSKNVDDFNAGRNVEEVAVAYWHEYDETIHSLVLGDELDGGIGNQRRVITSAQVRLFCDYAAIVLRGAYGGLLSEDYVDFLKKTKGFSKFLKHWHGFSHTDREGKKQTNDTDVIICNAPTFRIQNASVHPSFCWWQPNTVHSDGSPTFAWISEDDYLNEDKRDLYNIWISVTKFAIVITFEQYVHCITLMHACFRMQRVPHPVFRDLFENFYKKFDSPTPLDLVASMVKNSWKLLVTEDDRRWVFFDSAGKQNKTSPKYTIECNDDDAYPDFVALWMRAYDIQRPSKDQLDAYHQKLMGFYKGVRSKRIQYPLPPPSPAVDGGRIDGRFSGGASEKDTDLNDETPIESTQQVEGRLRGAAVSDPHFLVGRQARGGGAAGGDRQAASSDDDGDDDKSPQESASTGGEPSATTQHTPRDDSREAKRRAVAAAAEQRRTQSQMQADGGTQGSGHQPQRAAAAVAPAAAAAAAPADAAPAAAAAAGGADEVRHGRSPGSGGRRRARSSSRSGSRSPRASSTHAAAEGGEGGGDSMVVENSGVGPSHTAGIAADAAAGGVAGGGSPESGDRLPRRGSGSSSGSSSRRTADAAAGGGGGDRMDDNVESSRARGGSSSRSRSPTSQTDAARAAAGGRPHFGDAAPAPAPGAANAGDTRSTSMIGALRKDDIPGGNGTGLPQYLDTVGAAGAHPPHHSSDSAAPTGQVASAQMKPSGGQAGMLGPPGGWPDMLPTNHDSTWQTETPLIPPSSRTRSGSDDERGSPVSAHHHQNVHVHQTPWHNTETSIQGAFWERPETMVRLSALRYFTLHAFAPYLDTERMRSIIGDFDHNKLRLTLMQLCECGKYDLNDLLVLFKHGKVDDEVWNKEAKGRVENIAKEAVLKMILSLQRELKDEVGSEDFVKKIQENMQIVQNLYIAYWIFTSDILNQIKKEKERVLYEMHLHLYDDERWSPVLHQATITFLDRPYDLKRETIGATEICKHRCIIPGRSKNIVERLVKM